MTELGLKGKSVLVSGASKGIGRGIADAFAKEGCDVSISARGEADLAAAANALRAAGVKVVALQADLTRADDIRAVYDETMARLGQIDVLINNAGNTVLGRSFDTSDEDWAASIALNLMSAIRFTRLVVPQMQARRAGRIINISSVSGHTVWPRLVDYQTTKAALIAFSKSIALDLAADNILVNCVCPGLVRTPLGDRLADSMIGSAGDTREEVYSKVAKRNVPLARYGSVDEVAALVVFLASERASYITGATYDIDGGVTKSF